MYMKHKIFKQHFLFPIFIIMFFMLSFVSVAHAVTPTLSVSTTSDGDTVQIYATGDPNASVLLFYVKTGQGQQIVSIGNTNSSGTLTTNVSSSTYGVATNSLVYVTVGGINGPQSPTVSWPTVTGVSNTNMVSLSQTGLVLAMGQSSTITASNLGSSSLYLSNNTSPAIANVNISGNQVTVFANSYGSTVATLCLISNHSNCSSVYVTVQNSSAQPLTFSQNSVSIYSGQTLSVQISGGSGTYYVSNNASQNQGVVGTSISGSTINLSTTSTTGSSSITICSTDNSSCGIINVTIGSGSTSAVSFSQSSPTVQIGQSINVSIYGPSGSLFYVSSNSSPSIVQPNLSGGTLTLLGITSGTSTISICAATNNCGILTVTVSYNSSTNGNTHPTLSQDTLTLNVGQAQTITISGGSMPYNIVSSSSNFFQPVLNNNLLTITGISIGSSAMNVCSYSGGCSTLSVNVVGTSSVTTLPTGCTSTSGYSQTTGVSCGGTSSPVVTIPAGCISTTQFSPVTGQSCPNYVYNPLVTTVTVTTPSTTTSPETTTTLQFTVPLKLGSTGAEVKRLQQKLKDLGYYKGKIDGGYGVILEKAVKAFQKAHKLKQLGNVGPGTRALLNKE